MQLGSDAFLGWAEKNLAKERIGFIANYTAVDARLVHTLDRMVERGLKVTALFGPEHGVWGRAQAGEKVENARHPRYGIPEYSLYGSVTKPTPEMVADVDVLVIELQDVGARPYTYLYTVHDALEAAAELSLPVYVLDRPNPLGPTIQGGILDPAYSSFVGRQPIPSRYGFTIGELARYFNSRLEKPAELTVMPLADWDRSSGLGSIPFVPPSPNLPTQEALLMYPGAVLFEGTNVSEGRGTTQPFTVMGAPWIDAFELAEGAASIPHPGLALRPVFFVPQFSKHKDEPCGGLAFHAIEPELVDAPRFAVRLLALLRQMYPESFAFLPGKARQPIDRLAGGEAVRHAIDKGEIDGLFDRWSGDEADFERTMRPFQLYARD